MTKILMATITVVMTTAPVPSMALDIPLETLPAFSVECGYVPNRLGLDVEPAKGIVTSHNYATKKDYIFPIATYGANQGQLQTVDFRDNGGKIRHLWVVRGNSFYSHSYFGDDFNLFCKAFSNPGTTTQAAQTARKEAVERAFECIEINNKKDYLFTY